MVTGPFHVNFVACNLILRRSSKRRFVHFPIFLLHSGEDLDLASGESEQPFAPQSSAAPPTVSSGSPAAFHPHGLEALVSMAHPDLFSSNARYQSALLDGGDDGPKTQARKWKFAATAAGDAVLRAAGGGVVTPHGTPFAYGKPDYRNGAFIALGGFAL